MQTPKPVTHTQPLQDGEMGIQETQTDERALIRGEGNRTNGNILESNGQREQDKDERERARE